MPVTDRVLVVDDDPNICTLLEVALAPLECEVTTVTDGHQALERIDSGDFNAVVLDLMLPGPGGMEILRHIREQPIEADVIIVTAYASLVTAVEALRLGAYDYVTKPFQIDIIQSTVSRALEKQRLERRLAAIRDLSREMALALDLNQVAEAALDIVERVLEFEVCSLWLIDEARSELHLAAAHGMDREEAVSRLPMDGEKAVVATAAAGGEPLYVPDVREGATCAALGAASCSAAAVPLQVKERVIGVLSVESVEADAFSESDMSLLSTLAAQAAVAIENARLFEEVHAGRQQLQALSRRLVEVQEAERGHVARELHDETGQALSSLLLGLSLLEREADRPEAVVERATELEALADGMFENLHRLAMNLRPAALDHLGLVAALSQYVDAFSQQHEIPTHFEATDLAEERLSAAVETALYRIVQEALTNVARHAQANRVDVVLQRRGNQVVAVVEDDGEGFDAEAAVASNRLGLFGMRERAEMLNGTLAIESAIGKGTTVSVEVPFVQPSEQG